MGKDTLVKVEIKSQNVHDTPHDQQEVTQSIVAETSAQTTGLGSKIPIKQKDAKKYKKPKVQEQSKSTALSYNLTYASNILVFYCLQYTTKEVRGIWKKNLSDSENIRQRKKQEEDI